MVEIEPSKYDEEPKDPEEIYQDQLKDLLEDIDNSYLDAVFSMDQAVGLNRHTEQMTKLIETYSDKYQDFLKHSGLTIDLREFSKEHWKEEDENIDEPDEVKNVKNMVVNVEDRVKFVDFLKGFGEYGFDEKKVKGLDELAILVDAQIMFIYKTEQTDDDFLSLVPVIKEMATQYDRISKFPEGANLKRWSEVFRWYGDAISGKYFKELLNFKELDLKFGLRFGMLPRDRILPAGEYKNNWEEILKNVEGYADNKNAHQFVRKVVGRLQEILFTIEGDKKIGKNDKVAEEYASINNEVGISLKRIGAKIK